MKRLHSLFAIFLMLCMLFSLFSCTQNAVPPKNTESGDLMNYYETDVSPYISLSESDYKNAVFSYVSSTVPSLDACLEQIKIAHPATEKITNEAIKATDTIALYFYGEVDGMPFNGSYNVLNSKPARFPISNAVWEGFAEALTGVIPNQTLFMRDSLGIPGEGSVLYFSCTGEYTEMTDGIPNGNYVEFDYPIMRLDTRLASSLDEELLEELYKLTTDAPSKSLSGIYWDIDKDGAFELVDFTALKLLEVTDETPLTVDLTIPMNYYDETLRGKTATFQLFIKHIEKAVPATIDREFITSYFPLVSLDGKSPTEALGDFVEGYRKTLQAYEDYEAMSDAFYDVLMEKAEVLSYPPNEVEGYMALMRKEAIDAFELNKTMVELGYPGYRPYTSLEAYAKDYFSIKDDVSLEDFLEERAKAIVKRSLILGYILQKEDLDVSEEGIEAYKTTYFTRLSDYSAAFESISQGTIVSSDPQKYQEEYEKTNEVPDLVPYLVFDHLKDQNTFVAGE